MKRTCCAAQMPVTSGQRDERSTCCPTAGCGKQDPCRWASTAVAGCGDAAAECLVTGLCDRCPIGDLREAE